MNADEHFQSVLDEAEAVWENAHEWPRIAREEYWTLRTQLLECDRQRREALAQEVEHGRT